MTLQKLFHSCAKKYAPLEAIVAGPRRVSFEALENQVLRFQARLQEVGIRRGQTVAMMLPNSIEFVVAYFAITGMGATVIPINPTLTLEEVAYICADGSASMLICHTLHEKMLDRLREKLPQIQNIVVAPETDVPGHHSFSEWLSGEKPAARIPTDPIHPQDVAAILYTSGTTGKPKGAMLTHQNLYSNSLSAYETLGCSSRDAFLVALPLFHAFQATVGMLTPLWGGCKMVIADEFKPATIFGLIEKEGLTVFLGVPSMYLLLTRSLDGGATPRKFFRLCVSGGAALPVSVAREFEKKFSVPIHEGYGLTEASPVCAVNPIHLPPRLGSIGLPLKGVELRVMDDAGNEVPRGQVGELAVRGDNVMKGYHGQPEETRKAIVNGWLHTGDMARQDEAGYFYIVDRKKEMIIVAGENVYPREVEEVLYAHPAVVEAAVIGAPDELRGEVPVAFIRLKENAAATKKDILKHCKEVLAPYKIPRHIRFIGQFPKNATGKILKNELRHI